MNGMTEGATARRINALLDEILDVQLNRPSSKAPMLAADQCGDVTKMVSQPEVPDHE